MLLRNALICSAFALASQFGPVAIAQPANTVSGAFDGYEPGDPVGSAARELVRLVRQNCDQGDKRFVLGVASLPVETQAFTKDQGNHLMGIVHASFSRLPNVQMAPFRDVGAINELKTVGLTSTANAGTAEQLLQQVQIVVQASGQKFGPNIRFQLTAIGRGDIRCFEATPMVDVPQSMAGEVFTQSDNIFNAAARDLWERSRGVNQVAVQSRSVTGASIEPQLPGYFTTKMRHAVSSTRGYASENLGTPTELEVVSSDRATLGIEQRWDADVVVEQRANGYKISLDVTRPNTTPIAHYGLVSVDELPALRRADLQRTPSIVKRTTSVASKPSRTAVDAPRSGGDAAVLTFSLSPTRVQDVLDDDNREQRYAMQLKEESFVELDVQRLSGTSSIIKPEIYGENGFPIDAIFAGKARPNLRRYRLSPGKYEVRLTTEGRGKHDFLFSSRAVEIGKMLEPEAPGQLTRRFQDWYAGETRRAGKRVCYVYTTAMQAAPVGWREQRPIIWLSMSEDPGEPLNHMLDDVQRYGKNGVVKATIETAGGVQTLEVKALNAHIQPVTANAAGVPILNRDAIRGYTVGLSIELDGVTPEGKPAQVKYSLLGYRSAVNAASIACGRHDLAKDLVWR